MRSAIPLILAVALTSGVTAQPDDLRVCADPNNLPFSDAQSRGFENKLAEMLARELGQQLSYVWWAQRRGFIRNTLNEKRCDIVMGVPQGYDPVTSTRPYYQSSYVFVSREDRDVDISSFKSPQLRALRIGVHLTGDDGMNTPPAHALAQMGIVDNVAGFTVFGDYGREAPPARLIEAVEKGDIDIAIAWGPLAGYAARLSTVPLRITPVNDDAKEFAPLKFKFSIAIGVRKGEVALQRALDEILQKKSLEIEALFASYNVPMIRPQAE